MWDLIYNFNLDYEYTTEIPVKSFSSKEEAQKAVQPQCRATLNFHQNKAVIKLIIEKRVIYFFDDDLCFNEQTQSAKQRLAKGGNLYESDFEESNVTISELIEKYGEGYVLGAGEYLIQGALCDSEN